MALYVKPCVSDQTLFPASSQRPTVAGDDTGDDYSFLLQIVAGTTPSPCCSLTVVSNDDTVWATVSWADWLTH